MRSGLSARIDSAEPGRGLRAQDLAGIKLHPCAIGKADRQPARPRTERLPPDRFGTLEEGRGGNGVAKQILDQPKQVQRAGDGRMVGAVIRGQYGEGGLGRHVRLGETPLLVERARLGEQGLARDVVAGRRGRIGYVLQRGLGPRQVDLAQKHLGLRQFCGANEPGVIARNLEGSGRGRGAPVDIAGRERGFREIDQSRHYPVGRGSEALEGRQRALEGEDGLLRLGQLELDRAERVVGLRGVAWRLGLEVARRGGEQRLSAREVHHRFRDARRLPTHRGRGRGRAGHQPRLALDLIETASGSCRVAGRDEALGHLQLDTSDVDRGDGGWSRATPRCRECLSG